jgi:hypothetical protein
MAGMGWLAPTLTTKETEKGIGHMLGVMVYHQEKNVGKWLIGSNQCLP